MTCGEQTRGSTCLRGFTIIEVLVAAAITLVIAMLVVGAMANVLGNWNRTQGALSAAREARVIFDRLEQDLQGALCRNDENNWLAATIQSTESVSGTWADGGKPAAGSLDPASARLADARFGVAGVWLRFFTIAAPVGSNSGDAAAPIAVSYQIIRRQLNATDPTPRYFLYRAEVGAAETISTGYDLNSTAYLTASDMVGAAGNLVRPGPLQVLAGNVIDFGVRFYSIVPINGAPPVLQLAFPTDNEDLDHLAQWSSPAADVHLRFPMVVDVLLRILTDEGARQIAALEAGQRTGAWWTVANEHSRVFVRRIRICAGGS